MRWLSRAGDDPASIRTRRLRRMQRRVVYVASAALVLAASAGVAWHLERQGRIAAALGAAETRFTADSAALDLKVESVEVEGRTRTSRQAILDALGTQRGMPILAVDIDAAKTRLEALPWIRAAAVERLLPDTLFVQIAERTPLAVWQHDGRFDLIDRDGMVIPHADVADFPTLPQIVGDGAPQAAATLIDLLASEPSLQHHVTAAVRIGERRWNIELDSGIEVALPETGADAAWRRLAALDRSDHLLARQILSIDLRLPDRTALRLPPEIAKSLIKKRRPTGPNT